MRLYLKYCSIILRSQMQYKVSFLLTSLGQFLVSFSGFLSLYFLFLRFNSVDGFAFSEVLICFAVIFMSFSMAECFFRGFDTFTGIISNGEFDRIMVRPRNEILQVLGSRIEFTRIGRFIQAAIVLIYAIPNSNVDWTPTRILTLVFMLIGGVMLFVGLFITYASICFFTTEGLEFMSIFTDGGRELGKYPLAIYGDGILKFFTYLIPLSLIQYYPFLYLIGRTNDLRFIFLPLSGLPFLIICLLFWHFGISHYKSTGS